MGLSGHQLKLISIYALLSVPVLYLGTKAILNYKGYCFAEGKFLANNYLHDSAIQILISRGSLLDWKSFSEEKSISQSSVPKYKSFVNFKKDNPNCCKLGPLFGGDYPPPALIDRITGYAGYTVFLTHTVIVNDINSPKKKQQRTDRVVLSNCGEIY